MGTTQPASILITAGPTHEPIDAVRYIANRSSGKMGMALALAAAEAHPTTLLLGPTCLPTPESTRLTVRRFRTAAELERLLAEYWPRHDVLIMAAAVADYRPRRSDHGDGKLRRRTSGLTLELEATPDLLAGCAAKRRPGQRLIGFALEPAADLATSAKRKLERKELDAIVANPIETMDADSVDGYVLLRSGKRLDIETPASKRHFAASLIAQLGTIPARS